MNKGETMHLSESQKKKVLATIDHDIALCQAWASYHQAMAITGVATNQKLFHGTKGPEFTPEEKIEDSMNTAKTHLYRMSELIDIKKGGMRCQN